MKNTWLVNKHKKIFLCWAYVQSGPNQINFLFYPYKPEKNKKEIKYNWLTTSQIKCTLPVKSFWTVRFVRFCFYIYIFLLTKPAFIWSEIQPLSEIKSFCNIIHYTTQKLGVSRISFLAGCIKLIKSDGKTMLKCIMLQKISISDKLCSSELSIHLRNLKNIILRFQQSIQYLEGRAGYEFLKGRVSVIISYLSCWLTT